MNDTSHYTEISQLDNPVTVKLGDKGLAQSDQVLQLIEFAHGNEYPAMLYFPRDSVAMQNFRKIDDFSTHCPIKGDASYYDLVLDGNETEKAVWSYEDPLPENSKIKNHIAFDLSKLSLDFQD